MITKPVLTIPPWADAAGSADMIEPDSTYIVSGFPHTNDKPTRQTMNWILNYCSNGVQYLTARGIPDWDAAQLYTAGDVVRFQGRFYSALQSNNVSRSPSTESQWWSLWYVFQADLNNLYVTPAQIAASYPSRAEIGGTYATITNVNTADQNLQNQINQITAVTGRGYFPGAGISIDSNNVISNTAINEKPDWNSAVGMPQEILNKPDLAAVATSGSYNDLINLPALAPVALSGSYNDLTNLPTISSGQGRILFVATSSVTAGANTINWQPLMNYIVPAGLLNTPGRAVRGIIGGSYSTRSGQTPGLQIIVTLGGMQIFGNGTGSLLTVQNYNRWRGEFEFVVRASGTSGQVNASGVMLTQQASGVNAALCEISLNSIVAPIDFTVDQSLAVQCLFTTNSSTPNACMQDQFILEVVN